MFQCISPSIRVVIHSIQTHTKHPTGMISALANLLLKLHFFVFQTGLGSMLEAWSRRSVQWQEVGTTAVSLHLKQN